MAQSNPFLALEQRIVGDIYTSTETMDNLTILCDDFGSRFGGSESERQAAEFLAEKLREYGLTDVHLEPVDYIGWTRGTARLEIISPIEREISCISLPHSPPTNMEASIIDIGDGAPDEFGRREKEIEGKVVMVTSVARPKGSRRWIHREEKYGLSLMAGATGFIFVNHYPGFGPATGGVGHDGEALIPGISICKEDGAFIQRLMKRRGPVRIRLTTTDHSGPMISWNVVGDLRGQKQPDRLVMVGSHYDGHDISQGAEDPASGVVAVLEAARVLAKYAPGLPCTVRFVLWGIEEIGLLGSKAYVEAHADILSGIRFYLNMDTAGAKGNNRDLILNEWPDLEPIFERWREEMGLDFAVAQSLSAHSDHYHFFLNGVPTGGLGSAEPSTAGRGYGHTQYDTVDKLELVGLREAASFAARLVLRIASAENWPAQQRTKEAVLELLEGPDHQAEQAFRARRDAFYERVRGVPPAAF